ncbi:hypothetical protein F5Y05DRAFT_63377 [Hypoxylon sp. FL0543]|nr:hypothetical protein F5Y05DRAFT_63377 [Hypoxylon sp. FL0543]
MDRSSSLQLEPAVLETVPPQQRLVILRRLFQSISAEWAQARREVWSDLRSIKWARVGLWIPCVSWTGTMLGLFIYLAVLDLLSIYSEHPSTACRPDGSFNFNLSEYSSWTASGFFDINLGFGDLTFTQVKVIDISWDITIGRWGQVLMAFISWRAFADYVTTSMAFVPVTYVTFFTVFLENEPSFLSTLRVTRAFISDRGIKSKISMGFMILSMLFLIGWPTMASAMTGYTTLNKAFVPDTNVNYIPFSDFQPIAYIVHDGWRVNLTGNQPVSVFGSNEGNSEPVIRSSVWSFEDVSTNGFFGLRNTSSTWNGSYHLDSPILNISAFYVDPSYGFYGYDWSDSRSMEHKQPFADPSTMAFTYSNQTYPVAYIKDKGICQPVQDRFQWGFSFIQLLIAVISLEIWTVGTYMMWLKAQYQLPLQDRQLKREIRKQLRGGAVTFETALTRRGYSFRHGLRQWWSKERKWSIIFLWTMFFNMGSVLIFLFRLSAGWSFCGGLAIVLAFLHTSGIVFAMVVGTTKRSRSLMSLCWCLCGIMVNLILYFVSETPVFNGLRLNKYLSR